MPTFLTGTELNDQLGKLFESSKKSLAIICPFIKLNAHYESILKAKKSHPELEIIIVFGKNEDNVQKSISPGDIQFFTEFPNIKIYYERRLHAKIYVSENAFLISSMNLHSYSQENNIEIGVFIKRLLLEFTVPVFMNEEDQFVEQTKKYFKRVIDQAELIYHKAPHFDNGFVGTGLNRKYLNSTIEVDKLSTFFFGKNGSENREAIGYHNKKEKAVSSTKVHHGYCIRTGKPIPFNIEKPMSEEAYQSWAQYGNDAYEEKFCHYSGEPSYGETSKAFPIIRKNWERAKQEFNL
jgi:phosphatidylserine/phosphatidylglycerophosphate/cardiolipin synthase-like enzyme